jgi:hypothetical protein
MFEGPSKRTFEPQTVVSVCDMMKQTLLNRSQRLFQHSSDDFVRSVNVL